MESKSLDRTVESPPFAWINNLMEREQEFDQELNLPTIHQNSAHDLLEWVVTVDQNTHINLINLQQYDFTGRLHIKPLDSSTRNLLIFLPPV